MACGTPVVAFDVGGVSEIVINNKTGLLADSKDEKDLAENIQKLLTSNSLHNKMSVECRAYAIGNVSMDMFVNNYLELFSKSFLEHRAYPGRTTNSH